MSIFRYKKSWLKLILVLQNLLLKSFTRMQSTTDILILKFKYPMKKIKCHSLVIRQKSEFFDSICSAGLSECYVDINTEIDDSFPSDLLDALLQFLYLGTTDFNDDTCFFLLATAKFIKCPELIESCETFLVSTIDLENILDTSDWAEKFDLARCRFHCSKFLKEHFVEMSHTDWFSRLSWRN